MKISQKNAFWEWQHFTIFPLQAQMLEQPTSQINEDFFQRPQGGHPLPGGQHQHQHLCGRARWHIAPSIVKSKHFFFINMRLTKTTTATTAAAAMPTGARQPRCWRRACGACRRGRGARGSHQPLKKKHSFEQYCSVTRFGRFVANFATFHVLFWHNLCLATFKILKLRLKSKKNWPILKSQKLSKFINAKAINEFYWLESFQ